MRPTLTLRTLLDSCVSSLRRGHASLLCIVPMLTDDPRRESKGPEPSGRLPDKEGDIFVRERGSGLHSQHGFLIEELLSGSGVAPSAAQDHLCCRGCWGKGTGLGGDALIPEPSAGAGGCIYIYIYIYVCEAT